MNKSLTANLFGRFKSQVKSITSVFHGGRMESAQWDDLRQEVAQADRSRFLTAAMVVVVSMAVTIVNSLIIEKEKGQISYSSKDRQVASIAFRAPRSPETIKWEKSIVAQLSRYAEKASQEAVGSTPSPMERLVFGTLEGRYAAHMQDGKLYGLEFSQSDWTSHKPKYIDNRERFLRDNEALFPVNFALLHKTKPLSIKATNSETYEMMSENREVLGLAHFELDGLGRFIALKVNPMTSNK